MKRIIVALTTLIVFAGNSFTAVTFVPSYSQLYTAISNAQENDIIIIKFSEDIISTLNISGKNNLTIASQLGYNNITSATKGIVINNCQNITIKGFRIIMNNSSNVSDIGIDIKSNCSNISIEDCRIEGTGSESDIGISNYGIASRINNTHIRNVKCGSYNYGSPNFGYNLTISNCELYTYDRGISIFGVRSCSIRNCKISSNNGIFTSGTGNSTVFIDYDTEYNNGSVYGIYANGSTSKVKVYTIRRYDDNNYESNPGVIVYYDEEVSVR